MKDSPKAVTVLLRASQSVAQVVEADISSYGLNTTEFGTLEYLLHKGKQPIHNICSKLLMANSSMTYVVDQLEKKGLVVRTKDTQDRRKIVIDLTEEGRDLISKLFPLHEQKLNQVFDVLTDEELNQMMSSLKKLGTYAQKLFEIKKH